MALIEFKSVLTAISPLLEDWNASDASPCSWGSINCTDSGRVRIISLSAQEPMLEGNISGSLGKLEFLEGLVLDQEASLRSLATESPQDAVPWLEQLERRDPSRAWQL